MIHGKRYPINSPQGKAISVGLLLVGLLLCLLGLPGTREYHRVKDELVEVHATITGASIGSEHHRVYVTYTYDGKVYEDVKLNAASSDMREGMQITVPIHPDDPGKPVYNTMAGIFGFGLFYTAFSALAAIAAFRPRKETEKPPVSHTPERKKGKKEKHR